MLLCWVWSKNQAGHRGGYDTAAAVTAAKKRTFTMAADQNPSSLRLKHIDLAALTKRLEDHADGIENAAARAMADDMRLASQVINQLVEEVRTAATTTNGAIAHLVDKVGWQ
jgi:hypothetical protein